MKVLKLTILSTLLLAAYTTLPACSGDETNEGGSGGSGSTSTVTSTGATNPTGNGRQACADLCHEREISGCNPPQGDCNAACDKLFEDAGAECEDELGALYECYLPLFKNGGCPDEAPEECDAQAEASSTCESTYGCSPGGCSEGADMMGNSSCECTKTCAMKGYKTSCTTTSAGSTCECLVDGESVGTCSPEPGAGDVCDIKAGCCAMYFKL